MSVPENLAPRVRSLGVRAVGPVDLLAIAFARRESDAVSEDGKRLLGRFRNPRGLIEAGRADLTEATGLDDFEILRCQALMELGRRSALQSAGEKDVIEGPEDIALHLAWMEAEKREHFVAIHLDTKHAILRTVTVHIGTLDMSVVGPREIFREAIRDGAAAIVVAHNHPSGNPDPSPEDLAVTRKLVEIGKLLDIPVLDHVVVGASGKFHSFARSGQMR